MKPKFGYGALLAGVTALAVANGTVARAQQSVATPPLGTEAATQNAAADDALRSLALRDALVLAYDHNPSLEGQRALLRAADHRFVQAKAAYGPTLSAQADYGYDWDREFRTGPLRDVITRGRSGQAGLVMSQPLYTSGRLRSAENQALHEVRQGMEQVRSSEIQTMLETVNAFVGVLLQRDLLQIAFDNQTNLSQQRSDGTIRFGVREITLTDLEQIKTQAELANARVDIAQGAVVTSESEFLRVVGAVPHELQPLPPLPPLPASLEEAYAVAEGANPALLAARARERASRAVVERIKGENGPQVNLQGRVSYNVAETGRPTSPFTPAENDRAIGRGEVTVSVPLYSSGLNEARVAEARALNDADWRAMDQTLRDVRQAVAESWGNLVSTRLSIGSFEAAVEAAQNAFEGAVIQQRAGDRSTQDVLILARDLLEARSNLASARANEYIAGARVLAVTGRLELELLVPNAATYDPYREFRKIRAEGSYPFPTSFIARQLDSVAADLPEEDRQPRDPAAHLTLPEETVEEPTP